MCISKYQHSVGQLYVCFRVVLPPILMGVNSKIMMQQYFLRSKTKLWLKACNGFYTEYSPSCISLCSLLFSPLSIGREKIIGPSLFSTVFCLYSKSYRESLIVDSLLLENYPPKILYTTHS